MDNHPIENIKSKGTAPFFSGEKSGMGLRAPIIVLTAGKVKGKKEKCYVAGMDDYMISRNLTP